LPNTGTCSATSSTDGTGWYDPVTNRCVHGYFTNITFNFGHVVVPNKVIYGIAYNTTDYGYHPYGPSACNATTAGCGYDSLNVGYSTEPFEPSVGGDPNPGTAYLYGTYAPFYCDDGVVGTFRIDGRPDTNNCWNGGGSNTGYSYYGIENGGPVPANQVSPYVVPSVQFHAVNSPSPSFTSLSTASVVAGTSFSFLITTTGVPTPALSMLGRKLPKGLSFVNNGDGTATISGTALTRNLDRNYSVVVKARNARNSSAKQRLTLTLTGGRP
jgi:Putative Ig domain